MAMSTALSTAVSGLKSQQTGLDVTANNISNVNTTAYKAQTVSFSDLLSQTIKGASSATSTTGSSNAQQVGMGVGVASTSTDLSVGSSATSSNALDVALGGDGYFVVQTSDGSKEYTRAGNLSVDSDGNLTIDGYKVCGWESYSLDSDGNKVYTTSGAVEPINVYTDAYAGSKKVMAAKTTTSSALSGNLNSSSTVVSGATLQDIGSTTITSSNCDKSTTIDVYDEQGNKTEATVLFKKCATVDSTTSWYWQLSAADATISPSSGYIAFDSDGKMVESCTDLTAALSTNTTGYTDSDISLTSGLTTGSYSLAVASGTSSGSYDVTLTYPKSDGSGTATVKATTKDGSATFITDAGTVTLDTATLADSTSGTFTVTSGSTYTFNEKPTISVKSTTNNTDAVSVALDFSALKSTGTDSSLSNTTDGYKAGTLTGSYSINTDGTITAYYSNGKNQTVGEIALAMFDNPGGLTKTGDNLYTTSTSSGNTKYVEAGTEGSGTMTGYELELSNVDLAQQFSNMMIFQRAYQANSKVISTSDTMLETLINMVR